MRESPPRRVMVRPVLMALAGPVAFAALVAAADKAFSAPAPSTAGRAIVIDGDTLDIGGERIRLEGIDAPEHAQTCEHKRFGSWACGSAATRKLQSLVGNGEVECESVGRDTYGRMLGLCFVGGRDINAEMVRSGMAWAFVKYSDRYVTEEAGARDAKVGVWRGKSDPAWVFRQKQWSRAQAATPSRCAIKGNISENGQIYHMPWSPWYAKVRVEPEKGERWFCSERDAERAGFRPAQVY